MSGWEGVLGTPEARGAQAGREPKGEPAPCQKVERRSRISDSAPGAWDGVWEPGAFAGEGCGIAKRVSRNNFFTTSCPGPSKVRRTISVVGIAVKSAYAISHIWPTVGGSSFSLGVPLEPAGEDEEGQFANPQTSLDAGDRLARPQYVLLDSGGWLLVFGSIGAEKARSGLWRGKGGSDPDG